MSLPIFQSQGNQPFMLLQTQWASQLNPIIGNPATNPTLLFNIQLSSGNNVINHHLRATPKGWFICDINAASQIYRSAPFNELTLTLNASVACTVSIGVF